MSGTIFKKNKNLKIQSIMDHHLCYIQLFSVLQFPLVFIILPDVLSLITPCGIVFALLLLYN